MSGGSYNYEFIRVEDEYVDKMFDDELNSLMKDLVKLLHDLEWWQSSDYGEEDYRKTVDKFKKKYLKQYNKKMCYDFCPHKKLSVYIQEEIERLKELEEINANKNNEHC